MGFVPLIGLKFSKTPLRIHSKPLVLIKLLYSNRYHMMMISLLFEYDL